MKNSPPKFPELKLWQIAARAAIWHAKSDAALRLACGELTAQEIRSIRAVLRAIVSPGEKK